jgi:hypothetical protein
MPPSVAMQGRPRVYGWPLARVACSDLRESGSSGRVKYAVAKPIPPMLLASSHPHDKVSFKILGARIVLWPMDRPCCRCVLGEAAVDRRIAVRRGGVLWVEVNVGRRLALVGQSPCLHLGARLATM